MITIYKYPLNPATTKIYPPEGAEVLCVQVQNGNPFLWMKVDTNLPSYQRVFHTYATGQDMSESGTPAGKYVGTFQLMNGSLVFHVFEEAR